MQNNVLFWSIIWRRFLILLGNFVLPYFWTVLSLQSVPYHAASSTICKHWSIFALTFPPLSFDPLLIHPTQSLFSSAKLVVRVLAFGPAYSEQFLFWCFCCSSMQWFPLALADCTSLELCGLPQNWINLTLLFLFRHVFFHFSEVEKFRGFLDFGGQLSL